MSVLFSVREFELALPDTVTRCITFGTGPKAMVMIQGLNTRPINGAGLSLAWMYRLFAKDYRVYLFDRRAEVRRGITVRELAADTAAAMDALGITNAHILGVSQGGMIGQYLAIDRPDLVEKLVLAMSLSRTNETVAGVIRRWVDMTRQGNMKALVADMAERMYSPEYLKRYRPFLPLLTLLQKSRDTERFITLAQACLTCSTYDELDKIRCPVFVIGAGQDAIVGGEASREMAEKLDCPLFMYEHLGHAAYEEAADFNKLVYDFFRRQP